MSSNRRGARGRGASIVGLGIVLGFVGLVGCGGGDDPSGAAGSGAGSTGAAGTGAAGTGVAGTTGAAGTTGVAGTTGAAGTGAAGTSAAGTTGAAGTGAAGTTGAAGSGAALVQPIMRGNLYVLEFGKTKLVVDPAAGARISELSLDGTNIFTGPAVNAKYWGSTFWTAPEGEWMPNLVPGFDTAMFTMSVAGNTITGVGPNAMFAGKTLSITKKLSADLAKGAFDLEYSITNKGTNTFTIGHWEVSRVPPGGLTFFPNGTGAPRVYGKMNVVVQGGYVWFDHTKYDSGTGALTDYGKYSQDGMGGWVAHVVADTTGAGDILFVKTFKDIPTGTAGAGHGEVEMYASPDRGYEEVEIHHEQASFAPNATIPWPVRWYLRRLPVGVTRTVGNQALIDYVQALIK